MTIRSLRTFFDEKKVVLVFLVLLCVTAFYLRSYNVLNRMRWDGDPARDLLVSKHMAFYGESLIVGHTASGAPIYAENSNFLGVLHYPTYYYSYLSILWRIFNSLEGVVLFTVFLHSLSLVGVYAIVLLLTEHKWVSLFTVLMFTFSEFFIDVSQSLIGLQVSIPFVILCGLFITYGWKGKKRDSFFLGLSGLTFLTTFNYALLIIVGWILLFFAAINIRKIHLVIWLYLSQGCLFFYLHFSQIIFFNFSNFVGAFLDSNSVNQLHSMPIWFLVDERVAGPLRSVFRHFLALPVFALVCLLSLLILKFRHLTVFRQTALLFFGCVIISFFFLGLTKSGVFIESYLYYADIMVVMLLGIGWGVLFQAKLKNWYLFGMGYFITLCIYFGSITYGYNINFYKNSLQFSNNSFGITKKLAEKMLQEFDSPQNFGFNLSFDYSEDWESPTVGYWLEELSGEKIYSLVDYSNNLKDSQVNNKLVIISACKIYPDQESLTQLSCESARSWSESKFPTYREYKQEIFADIYLLTYLRKTEQE